MASTIKVDKIEGSTGSTITIPTGQTLTVTDGVPVASGGTGLASFTTGDILYATGSTTLAKLGKGTGLQGLQTNSGATAPEWANSPQSLMTAAGDIIYASGANTLAKLAKGSDDDVLTLASGVPSWAASAGGGKIGQVVQAVHSGTENVGSATAVTIPNFSCAITPTATDSKILVTVTAFIMAWGSRTAITQLFRDTTQIYMGDAASPRPRAAMSTYNTINRGAMMSSACYLDSPSTTSEVAYTLKWLVQQPTGTLYLNRTYADNGANATYDGRLASSITAMEVLA